MAVELTYEDIMESEKPIIGEYVMDSAGKDINFGYCRCKEHRISIKDSSLGKLNFNNFKGHIDLINCKVKEIVLVDEEDEDSPEREAPFKIIDCGVEGVHIKSRIKGLLEMRKNKFTGITDFSGSTIDHLDLSESNFDYTRFIEANIGELNLDTCRFVQLFDMKGTKVGSLNMSKAIVLETFVLPEIEKPDFGEKLNLTDLSINGKVSIIMPIGQSFENKFIKSFDKESNSSEFSALRQIFESNRRYSAADTAYIFQKRRECKESEENRADAVLTPFQRRITKFSYYLGGNGMRPSFTLVWLLVIALLFTIVMVVAGVENPHTITGNLFIDNLYLSASSLFLGNFLDVKGIGMEGYIICLVEGVIGVLLMLYFTVILTRKIIR